MKTRRKFFTQSQEKIQELTSLARHDLVFLWPTIIWLINTIVSLALISFFWTDIPKEVPIFYSHPWGITQLGSKYHLFLLPVSAFLLGVINTALALVSYYQERVVSYMFFVATSTVSFLATLAVVNIVRLLV